MRKIIVEQTIQQSIVNGYLEKIPIQVLQSKYNLSKRVIYNVLDENKIERKQKPISQQQLAEATKDLVSGMLMKNVTIKHKISFSLIYKYMRDNDINYYSDHGRKHTLNKHFFDVINTEEKAYWLGFIYADGYITKSNNNDKSANRLRINISSKDKILLEQFLQDIEATSSNITDYIPRKTYSTNQMSCISINSIELCNALISHGCTEKKTLTLSFPSSIHENLIHHFIRGYFDGDGTIGKEQLGIIGNHCFLINLQQILVQECNLKITKLYEYKHKAPGMYDLKYGGRIQLTRIYQYLYKDATRFLSRKFDKFTLVISN